MTIAISNASVRHLRPGRYQSALELRRRVAYPHRDLSEGLEVKASRGLADVRRAAVRSRAAPAAISERKRVVEEVPG